MENVYRIIAKSPDRKDAYAEKIQKYRKVSDKNKHFFIDENPVLYLDLDGREGACDLSDIVINPVINRHCAGGKYFNISLEGSEK